MRPATKPRLLLRLSDAEHRALRRRSAELGLPSTTLVRALVACYLFGDFDRSMGSIVECRALNDWSTDLVFVAARERISCGNEYQFTASKERRERRRRRRWDGSPIGT